VPARRLPARSVLARGVLLWLAAAPLQAAGLDPQKALTQYNLDVWTTSSGLPQNSVTALAQTRDGYLWIGTFGGLARFDGVRFRVFDRGSSPALPNSGIQTLLAARAGGLWIGTNGGGVALLRDGELESFDTRRGLAGDVVRALYEDRTGALWVGTNTGLTRIQGGRLSSFGSKQGLLSSVVRTIREDAEGTLWVGTNGGGLCRFDGRLFHCLGAADGLPNAFVFSLLAERDGGLWVGTNGAGLWLYKNGRFTRYGPETGLRGEVIWSLYEDRAGELWVGTYGAGLYRKRGDNFERLDTDRGLTSDFVRSLFEDEEGSLWIGTSAGGLDRLRDGKFTTYTTLEGLPDDVAKTVLADREGALWVGTSGGGLARLMDGRFTSYGRAEGLPNLFVQCLVEDRQGRVWAGTNGSGVAYLQGGRFKTLGVGDGLVDGHVSALAEDPAGGLWIGTIAGGLSHYAGGRFTRLTRSEGLPTNLVMALLVDHAGTLWVGTDGAGLARVLPGGAIKGFTSHDGLASDVVLALHEDEEGALWVGTSGGGLSRLKDGRFLSWTTRDGLLDDVVFSILEDGRGNVWLSGNKGVSRVSKAALLSRARPLPVTGFGIADGMKSNECSGVSQPAAARTPDGRLWYPTTRGIAGLDPARLPKNRVVPPVHVEELLAGGRSHPAGAALELPAGASSWEIRYTALSLLAPERVRFRYRLVGLDEDWVDAGTRRSAFYPQVPPGAYTFEVVASNGDGLWNETGDRLHVRLLPSFRQTLAFRLLLAGLVALAVAGAWRARVRTLEAHRRELEALVLARTQELRAEGERAERAREEAERLRGRAERQREVAQQASALKTELLQIAAHDLKNPLQMVLGFAEMAEQQLPAGSEVRGHLERISGSAGRMLDIVSGLVDEAALESGVLELHKTRLDLGELTRGVVDQSRGSAERKGQSLHFSAEGPAAVLGDEARLYEVLENLVSNAIKFSPPGAPIFVGVTAEGGKVACAVRDAGPGLTEDDKRKLFGRFQRLSARPTGGEPTTGLGLSIAKQLADLHGGRLWAESAGSGQGSRFVLELEAAAAPPR
jgi:signal transduction histidine kinase/ligand-binding sensor domain-containing protein